MTTLHCPKGHEVKLGWNPDPAELTCREHGVRLETGMQAKAKQRRSGGLRETSSAEDDARLRFNQIVCEWPCYFVGRRAEHRCWGRKDAHHLVPKDWIRRTFGDLPEGDLLAILYAPIIGASLCLAAHEAIGARTDFIYRHELDPELIEFCEAKGNGMLGRLELESVRGAVGARG